VNVSALARSAVPALVALVACAVPAALAKDVPPLVATSQAFEALAARVSEAVVPVIVVSVAPQMDVPGTIGVQHQGGSAVIVSADGDLITNAHVIAGARRIQIVLPAGGERRSILRPPGRRVDARVVGTDFETDLALLKIDAQGLPTLPFGDSDALKVGQIVFAIGNPLGLENSVSMGVVSAVARQLEPEGRMVWIQTDAAINPGNSGGALVGPAGELVGINSMKVSPEIAGGIGFAAPSNIVRAVYEQLRDHGRVRRGEIGAFAQTITPSMAAGLGLARSSGVILSDVRPGGPAHRAGLAVGDIVLALDDKPMENGRQLDVNLYRRPIGTPVRMTYERGGKTATVTVGIAARPEDPSQLLDRVSGAEHEVHRLGIVAFDLDRESARMLPWIRAEGGVVVAGLRQPAPWAEDGGLEPGDVVLAMNGHGVTGLAELRAMADALAAGAPCVLHVERRGQARFVTLELD